MSLFNAPLLSTRSADKTGTMSSITLQISGMTCGACAASVERALHSVPGVTSAAVNLTTTLAAVSFEEPEGGKPKPEGRSGEADDRGLAARTENLVRAVAAAGYGAARVSGSSAQTLREIAMRGQAEAVAVSRRLVFGIFAGAGVMAIDWFSDRLMGNHSSAGIAALMVAQGVLTVAVLAYTGRSFFIGAWRARRHPNMDTLVALGSAVATVYSLVLMAMWFWREDFSAAHGAMVMMPPMELHAAVTIVVLVLLGKHLETRAKRSANNAIAALADQSARTAMRRREDGTFETIPAEQIALGDTLQILAHQQLPVDGALLEGAGCLDTSIITGESVPIELAAASDAAPAQIPGGGILPGGATLMDGRILLRATSTANTSAVARIMELVQNAQASKTQIQGLADRVAGIFVPIVLVLGVLTFFGWLMAGHAGWSPEGGLFGRAITAAIAVIVIACPCAMGLATPTAITVATGRAARLGILFTNAAALETAGGNLRTVLFDKTGTLTAGRLTLHDVIVNPSPKGAPATRAGILAIAAGIEQFATHPLAEAIVRQARVESLSLLDPDSFNSVPGGGVKATLDGVVYALGSAGFLESLGIDASPMQAQIAESRAAGMTLVLLASLSSPSAAGQMRAILALRDTLRADAPAALAALKALHLHLGVLSGDTESAVRAALAGLPLDSIRASVKPEEKAAAVTAAKAGNANSKSEISNSHGVAFVGDGVNDAPALAAADLGIVVATGTDIAKAAGDVILVSGRLSSIPQTVRLAQHTLRIIRQNLFWAFAYNVAAIPLAALGILPPGVAAGAMVLSSLSVVGNALRLYRVKV